MSATTAQITQLSRHFSDAGFLPKNLSQNEGELGQGGLSDGLS
jgi:hypothetical protein